MSPEFPIYPSYPSFPSLPAIPSPGGLPSFPGEPGLAGSNGPTGTLGTTFQSFMRNVSDEVGAPQQIANDMLSGKRPFDTAELMLSMLEAEQKLNKSVRIINELVKGLKQIESIQV